MHLASDSSTLATGGDDGIVRLWDAQTGEQAQVDFRCHTLMGSSTLKGSSARGIPAYRQPHSMRRCCS